MKTTLGCLTEKVVNKHGVEGLPGEPFLLGGEIFRSRNPINNELYCRVLKRQHNSKSHFFKQESSTETFWQIYNHNHRRNGSRLLLPDHLVNFEGHNPLEKGCKDQPLFSFWNSFWNNWSLTDSLFAILTYDPTEVAFHFFTNIYQFFIATLFNQIPYKEWVSYWFNLPYETRFEATKQICCQMDQVPDTNLWICYVTESRVLKGSLTGTFETSDSWEREWNSQSYFHNYSEGPIIDLTEKQGQKFLLLNRRRLGIPVKSSPRRPEMAGINNFFWKDQLSPSKNSPRYSNLLINFIDPKFWQISSSKLIPEIDESKYRSSGISL